MFRATLYSLLLLPIYLLHAANASASIRLDSITTIWQTPKFYVVHTGMIGETVGVERALPDSGGPRGSNLVVYQNITTKISNLNGDLFIGPSMDYTMLIWVPEPFAWNSISVDPFGLKLFARNNNDIAVCWQHKNNSTSMIAQLSSCDSPDTYWTWYSGF